MVAALGRPLEVLPRALFAHPGHRRPFAPRRESRAAQLHESLTPFHLLGEEHRLDTVEKSFEPADELCVRDPQFGVRRRCVVVEGKAESSKFVTQIFGKNIAQLLNRSLIDVLNPRSAGFVQWCSFDLVKERSHHGRDAHDLGGMMNLVIRLTGCRLRAFDLTCRQDLDRNRLRWI